MKKVVLDSSFIITLASNNLLDIFRFFNDVDFCCPPSVKKEVVDNGLKTRKYKFQCLRIAKVFQEGLIKVLSPEELEKRKKELLNKLNKLYKSDEFIKVVHEGEVGALALARIIDAEAVLVDEKTTRLILEDPEKLGSHLESKLHRDIQYNKKLADRLQDISKEFSILRTSEVAMIAYEKGFFDSYKFEDVNLVEAILWSLRFKGCAISTDEIEEYSKMF